MGTCFEPRLPTVTVRRVRPRSALSHAVLTAATAIAILTLVSVAPLYGTADSAVGSDGQTTSTTGTATLLDVGLALPFYAVLAAFVVLLLIGAWLHPMRHRLGRALVGVGATGLVVATVLALMSIGLFLVPIVGLAWWTFSATRSVRSVRSVTLDPGE